MDRDRPFLPLDACADGVANAFVIHFHTVDANCDLSNSSCDLSNSSLPLRCDARPFGHFLGITRLLGAIEAWTAMDCGGFLRVGLAPSLHGSLRVRGSSAPAY
jgi:hypothetical protein